MRGVFGVEEPAGERWAMALELLRDGQSVSLGRVTFSRPNSDVFEAAVSSAWQLENVSHERAAVELTEARSLVQALVAEDPDFAHVVGRSPIDYVLVDDYDTGRIAIARLAADEVEWLVPHT